MSKTAKTPASEQTSFGFLVTDVTRLMRKVFDCRAARFGLTRAQWRALKRVSHGPGITQNELAEFLEMEPIAVGRVIDRLQKADFIERRADPQDRRVWRLHITEKAHDVVDDMELISAELFKQAQRGIAAADMKIMLDVFTRMKQNLLALDRAKDAEGERS